MSAPLFQKSPVLTCWPDPVVADATLHFQLQDAAQVVLKIHNAAEEVVRVLLHEVLVTGPYTITFDATHLPPGLYTARMVISTEKEVSIQNTYFRIGRS
ncbi:MAG: hypothetical protein IPO83_05855 [Chitinophagaceae bacterium]|nr:hypothetical protein [Chitinophagaceae bacterium]